MTDYKVTDTELTSVADAIRTKGGTAAQLEWPTGYVDAIGNISGGGGGTLGTKTITQNGTYDASDDSLDGYSSVTVNVSGGGGGFTPMAVSANSTFPQTPKQVYGAFGDVAGNFWGANGKNAYIEMHLPEAICFTKIKLANYYRVNSSTYWHSGNISIRGSNDDFSTYTELYAGTDLAQYDTQIEITLNNSTAYDAYRLFVYDSTSYVGLGRIELIE